MRKQTRDLATQAKRRVANVNTRFVAVETLAKQWSIRKVAEMTDLSKSLIGSIKQEIKRNGKTSVISSIEERNHKAGRRNVLTTTEEKMIVERIIFAAHRGFAVDNACLKYMRSHIAADGRPGWKGNAPSDDAVRSFREHNCEICLRTTQSKDEVKLKGESYSHVQTFFDELVKIRKRFPGIFGRQGQSMEHGWVICGNGVWKKTKSYAEARCHHGGSCPARSSSEPGKHVTAIIATSASGRKALLFFFVAGKLAMQHWIHSLVVFNRTNLIDINLEHLGMQDWFPSEGVIQRSENESTEQQNMHFYRTR